MLLHQHLPEQDPTLLVAAMHCTAAAQRDEALLQIECIALLSCMR